MQVPFEGGCACGQIRYRVSAEPVAMVNCHCRACQRASGGAGSNIVVVRQSDYQLLKGAPKSHLSKSDGGNEVKRWFCGECGSPLYSLSDRRGEFVLLKVGSLDDPSGFKPMVDVWTSAAQPWAHIASGVAIPKDAP